MRKLLCLFLLLAVTLRAESPLTSLGSAAGVVTVDTKGRHWAYLAWGAAKPELVRGKTFAVYGKPGGPEATAAFTRRAVVARQSDGRAVDSLLSRANFIGFNPADTLLIFDQLFSDALPAGTNTAGEKIAAAMRSANPQSEQLLFLLGSVHPGVNFALGLGHAERIGAGKTTFEIRDFDPVAQADLGLLWRVTVDTNAPVILPAPGAPVVVRDCRPDGTVTAKSNLVLPLRWSAPDPLRRLALFQRGYHVYRMRRAFAEARGFHTTPPGLAQLRSLLTTDAADVKRVSTAPVFFPRNLSASESADLAADSTTIFFTDANGVAEVMAPGQPPPPRFRNGDAFYYFVTARDLLGREGAVSPGGLAEVYELSPLDVPREVRATNDLFVPPDSTTVCAEQRLRVSWKQADNSGTTRPVLRYHVYRWASVNDLQLHADDPLPAYAPIVTLPHTANNGALSYKDIGPGAPLPPAATGRVVFYTVRAEAQLPCGPVRSPHSAPMSAALHDCTGPQAPADPLLISPCFLLSFQNASSTAIATIDSNHYRVDLIATRNNPLVDWAEFTVLDTATNGVRFQERVYFSERPGSNTATIRASILRTLGTFNRVLCQVGTCDGKGSLTQANVTAPDDEEKLTLNFGVRNNPVQGGDPDCASHLADPTGAGDTQPLKVCMTLTPDTREYRMYRRIDDGPPMLVKQGFRATGPVAGCIEHLDKALTAGVASAAYYGQLINDQGNSGPMALLGRREVVRKPPQPLFAPIAATGTAAAPTMTLRWFCQPGGIERFQIWISSDIPATPNDLFSTTISVNRLTARARVPVTAEGEEEESVFGNMHYSPRVGSTEIGSGPLFSLPLTTKPGVTYTIFIRPITAAGVCGPKSNAQKFTWTAPAQVGTVPWPARGLPKVNVGFNGGIIASTLRPPDNLGVDPQYPLGVKVGSVRLVYEQDEAVPEFFGDDPNTLIFKDSHGASLFPCVLYRYQIANEAFPQVSGDLTQVSPLIEKMKMAVSSPNSELSDPFFSVRKDNLQNVSPNAGIYLRDTQPALKGAAYKYLVVRFIENGEVADIIPTNTVTLPE